MNEAMATKKLYAITTEVKFEPWTVLAFGSATMNRVADRVWSKYGRGQKPRLIMGTGIPVEEGGYVSYFDPDSNTIVLARHQRSLMVLLHELAHALTPRASLSHGPEFCRMYAKLMGEFAGEDEDYLLLHMIDRGLLK